MWWGLKPYASRAATVSTNHHDHYKHDHNDVTTGADARAARLL
jgi:hypothetical protein